MRPAPLHRRPAFTLIELLTVIAIITLLIGIVTPALNNARKNAKAVATLGEYNAIKSGCEMFRNDYNKYPESYPASFATPGTYAADVKNWEVVDSAGTTPLSGANLIVDAMVGRDLNGYDSKPGTTQSQAITSRWYAQPDATTKQTRGRTGPYVTPDKIPTSTTPTRDVEKQPKDKFGVYPIAQSMPIADTSDNLAAPVFLDTFGYPILYYRANPNATPQTVMLQTTQDVTDGYNYVGRGVYDGRDNKLFTDCSQGAAYTGGQHQILDAPTGITPGTNNQDPSVGYQDVGFVHYIRSTKSSSYDSNAKITFSRPVNPDTFILASPGYDGIWGTADDIVNFDQNNK